MIEASIESVFQHYDDGRTYRTWMSRVADAEMLTDGPVTVASRFRARFKGLGTVTREVVQRDPPHRLVHLGDAPIGTMRHFLTFERTTAGVRVSQRGEGEPKPFLRLLGPVLRPMVSRSMAKSWRATAVELGSYLSTRHGD